MTSGPQLRLGKTLLPGLLAVALFGIMALVVLNTSFTTTMADAGFPDGISITSEIGYAMFDLDALSSTDGNMGATEPFLAAFLLIAVTLDAALDASLVLAKREEEGEPVAALSSTGPGDSGPGVGAGPAPDSSGFGHSEPTVTDGGGGNGSSSGGGSDGDAGSGVDAESTGSDDGPADTDTDTETETAGGDDR
ncbi:hypothetical protein GS429_18905 [Natronorubrum sp. JWXQ-INN-674]|uniref:Proton-conducting membrane transporter n=1 Tax=Natronorubrum halalkaliphilum TaxID=2691917 RepID=A0A6B0VSR6_9EURY|nr:hypothetical protein [Natronorubrum halalkaliphilum]MXV64097.1 hypothetical protein [Natronorubrum halalkaliphilum]